MTQEFRSDMEKSAWEIVKDLPEMHWSDLAAKGIAHSSAHTFMQRWERAGRIRMHRRDEQNRKLFVATDRAIPVIPPSPVAGQVPTQEGNMWRAMRRLGHFSPTDVAAHSNAGGVEVTIDKARGYCRQLLGAGYLKVRRTAIPGRREAKYQLIRDSGPLPPRPARVRGVLDPNDKTFMPASGELDR
ncbi:MAG: hypothetical protein GYB50_25380 [Rhodobacteraceae bacterium]|nr:hypothetical protein [Paracoccaceae bacterium]